MLNQTYESFRGWRQNSGVESLNPTSTYTTSHERRPAATTATHQLQCDTQFGIRQQRDDLIDDTTIRLTSRSQDFVKGLSVVLL